MQVQRVYYHSISYSMKNINYQLTFWNTISLRVMNASLFQLNLFKSSNIAGA